MSKNIPRGHVACPDCGEPFDYREHGFGLCPSCRRARLAEGGRRSGETRRKKAAPTHAEIRKLLEEGLSYRAIAYEVGVSRGTVANVATALRDAS